MASTIYGIDSFVFAIFCFFEKISIGFRIAHIAKDDIKSLVIDLYVIFKCFFAMSLLFLSVCMEKNSITTLSLSIASIYMIIETMSALAKKILYPSTTAVPSNRRASLLIIFNWLEVIILFATLYSLSNSVILTTGIPKVFDFFYFSFLSSVTMDMNGATLVGIGKVILICQITTFIIFLTLFFSHNFGRLP